MKAEQTHTPGPKVTKSHIDFIINQDTKVRFVPVDNDGEKVEYRACIYYKGMYDGMVQNMRYSVATQKDADEIFKAYREQELSRMTHPKSIKDGISRLNGNYDELLLMCTKASDKVAELLKENEQLKERAEKLQSNFSNELLISSDLNLKNLELQSVNAELLEALKTWKEFWDTMPKGQMGNLSFDLGLFNDGFIKMNSAISKAEDKS